MAGSGATSLRTLRNQSSCNGTRSLGSILASDAGSGSGSIVRLAKWNAFYKRESTEDFFNNVLQIKRGSFSNYDRYRNIHTFSFGR